jgi:hypothetical protein
MGRPTIALLRKDLRTTRIFWAPMAFSYGTFLLMFMENRWVFLATGVALAFIAAVTVLGIDDLYRSEPLYAALPGTRRGLVGGRYLGWGVFTAASLALFLSFAALLQAEFPERATGLASLLSIQSGAAFLAGAALAGAVFFPFYFRFGFWRGMWSSLATDLVLGTAILAAAPRLVPSGTRPLLRAQPTAGAFAKTVRGLRALAWIIDHELGRPEIAAATAAVLALLIWASYRLSVRFYRKRDL